MELELIREGSIDGVGTLGTLSAIGLDFYCIEKEWADNKSSISCVPLGRYRLEAYSSEKYPDHYALVNEDIGVYAEAGDIPAGEAGRWGILIHIANIASQLAGCIAPGVERGYSTPSGHSMALGVLNSTTAYNAIKARLDDADENFITISEVERYW